MKIVCSVCVVNRILPNIPTNIRKKPVKSTLALCKHPKNNEYCLLLFTGQNKNGTKYPVNNNIKQVLTRFVTEGKCTIQLRAPEVDLYIQADVVQLKGFLHLFARVLENKVSEKEFTFSSMAVTPVKQKDMAPKKLTITRRSDYPTKGFPRTLEVLFINDIERCGVDTGILQLTKLRVLDLSNNLIKSLPEDLNKLPNLRELHLSRNLLGKSSLKHWNWIGGLLVKNLALLDLSHNELQFVPNQLSKFQQLATLHLSNNSLKTLPTGIGNLKTLKIFTAANNAITSLPGSIKNLRLQSIDLTGNRFEWYSPISAVLSPRPLPVCSLKEYAARRVLWSRIPYAPGMLPSTVIEYLDHGTFCCVCEKPCFSVYVRHPHSLRLANISETIKRSVRDSLFVTIDCHFCSVACFNSAFHSRNRNPIIR